MQAVADENGEKVRDLMARNRIFPYYLPSGITGPANTMDGKFGVSGLYRREIHRKNHQGLGDHYKVKRWRKTISV
jgi:hypothetical protein